MLFIVATLFIGDRVCPYLLPIGSTESGPHCEARSRTPIREEGISSELGRERPQTWWNSAAPNRASAFVGRIAVYTCWRSGGGMSDWKADGTSHSRSGGNPRLLTPGIPRRLFHGITQTAKLEATDRTGDRAL